ncbi:type II toxin-antitoxin system VapC family toxin [Jiangella gansuensis]|uniref:type II toxin-antitoxin system VapC family toxin n=1 Tax=Jiangella gansuensis TaxID=281473 RepID=UPI00047B2604|nr:type II toxin-antitoxin system VapC family toxin [Jiangella gansuensis]
MIVDSSAVVSILLGEPNHELLLDHLVDAADVGIGVPTLVETGIVLAARLGPSGSSLLGRFVTEAGLRPVEVTGAHWPVAVGAYLRYGKGRHPAALNFGDCLTYAVAAVSGRPLLCVGDDFPQTDLDLVA